MYWRAPGADTWTEGHVSLGSPLATSMIFAEGLTGGAWDARTFLLLANPGGDAAVVTVRFLRAQGVPVQRQYLVPAGARVTVAVHDDPELAQAEFGMHVTSTHPVAAERSVYWTLGEGGLVGGTCAAPSGY